MSPQPDLVLANRAFVDHEVGPGERAGVAAGAGGLVAALQGVIAPWDGREGTTWIGAGRGAADRLWVDERGYETFETTRGPLRHRRLFFKAETWKAHYEAVSNRFLWPLLHLSHRPLPDLARAYPAPEAPEHEEWGAYRRVNEAFAEAALEEREGQSCWVHDYQLALVPSILRTRRFRGRIGFFLHTPVMDYAVASRYLAGPARMYLKEWLEGVLGSDLVGLQTEGDVARFESVASLCGFVKVPGGVARGGRTVRVEAIPVGPSIPEVEVARDEPLPALAGLPEGLPLVGGIERADYTKGIPERLQAIAEAYRSGARFAYIGLAAPTREGLPEYEDLRRSIASAAAEARVAAGDCPFVQMDQGAPWEQVVSLLRRADVVFTSSHADGMNLVPLQAAIAQAGRPTAERAVALAGRDSGVAQVHGCRSEGLVPVDPLDIHGMAATLVAAVERRLPPISDGLVARVRAQDATAWATRFLSILDGAE